MKTFWLQCWIAWAILLSFSVATADDLAEIKKRGVLRHLGVPYANFVRVTPNGLNGLDVELMRLFARHLGVNYEWVETSWSSLIGDLTGKSVEPTADGGIRVVAETAVRGDIVANGFTMLPWRKQSVLYSLPTFPTGVWLIARADSPIKPIEPTGDFQGDIEQVKALLRNRSVLTLKGTCLDPNLYDLGGVGADIRAYTVKDNLDGIVPSVINGAADTALLDMPNALVALQQLPGEVKVIGPVSEQQVMGVAVAKTSQQLLAEFNAFFAELSASGTYKELVRKYYPSIFLYRENFFH